MKLIKEFHDLSDAEDLSFRLERKGILTHISSVGSYHLPASSAGVSKVGVWVVFEKQYDDTFQLLQNKNHIVAYPLSEDEIKKLKAKASYLSFKIFSMGSFLNWFFSLVLIILICLVLYFFVSSD